MIPALMKAPDPEKMLENKFSIGDLSIRVACKNDDTEKCLSTFQRLENIRDINKKVKSSFQHLINYLMMKFVAAYMTTNFLKVTMGIKSTMVMSNVMGPRSVHFLEYPVDKMLFWVPHR